MTSYPENNIAGTAFVRPRRWDYLLTFVVYGVAAGAAGAGSVAAGAGVSAAGAGVAAGASAAGAGVVAAGASIRLFYILCEVCTSFEFYYFLSSNLDFFAGLRVASLAGSTF